jgi:hypothetical protein
LIGQIPKNANIEQSHAIPFHGQQNIFQVHAYNSIENSTHTNTKEIDLKK